MWVVDGWNSVLLEMIIQRFKVTRISNKIDKSEDDMNYEETDCVSTDFSNNNSSDKE